MPQMAPMSWMMLFSFFSMVLILMATLNYYLYVPKVETPADNMYNKKMLSWKW
uniref:ATP synthase complex subunit 8 n=1 Tax=Coeliccia cyanomelas TaxID=476659 RepID=A0A6C0R3N7_9ODON|nr:ATP synthase F0 subunit 8 [Coeliccia cyanomelas]